MRILSGMPECRLYKQSLYYQKRGYFRLLSSPSGAVGDQCCRRSFRSRQIESRSEAAVDFWEHWVTLHPHQPLHMLPAAEQSRLDGIRQVPLNYNNLKHFLPNLLSYRLFFFLSHAPEKTGNAIGTNRHR